MNEQEKNQALAYLIACLIQEMPEYKDIKLPRNEKERFNLYRALCNIRMPQGIAGHTLPDDFYTIQKELLRAMTKEKGITDVNDLQPSKWNMHLYVWQGDITTLKCDAIVNAANSQMLGCFVPLHGCIDNSINTMAGVELREKCYQIMKKQGKPEPTGKAKITPGYNLPAKYVIHTVGPIVQSILTRQHDAQLVSCYNSVLDLADSYHLKSVAFCCISTGEFHFPQDKAAKIAVQTAQIWLKGHPGSTIQKIVFNVFKDKDKTLYDQLLNA